jgi:hypothetical protein
MLEILCEYNLEKETIHVTAAGGYRSTNDLGFVFTHREIGAQAS